SYCGEQAEGGHLASIQSLAESAYVARLASNHTRIVGLWIGLSGTGKACQEPNRQWSDGSPFGYHSWKKGQPDNLLWNCVQLLPS
ncbi:C-type lectin lectoxin-Lio2-like, partial [Protobothrops mucrosquamatus]|uniref:C-type lectin lectoxin-Lio2-like n=1 Tax=Protobothrops mucrosquamatus TaxID=103944 RepID=UPI0010FB1776